MPQNSDPVIDQGNTGGVIRRGNRVTITPGDESVGFKRIERRDIRIALDVVNGEEPANPLNLSVNDPGYPGWRAAVEIGPGYWGVDDYVPITNNLSDSWTEAWLVLSISANNDFTYNVTAASIEGSEPDDLQNILYNISNVFTQDTGKYAINIAAADPDGIRRMTNALQNSTQWEVYNDSSLAQSRWLSNSAYSPALVAAQPYYADQNSFNPTAYKHLEETTGATHVFNFLVQNVG